MPQRLRIGPNWYATVMGTGIVALSATLLPVRIPGLHTLAVVAWLNAAALLVGLTALAAAALARDPRGHRDHALSPGMAPFLGAPPMAAMVVAAGSLPTVHLPVAIAATLWLLGTLAGLATTALVPFLMITRHENAPDAAFGGWLMPVVPPMVSAATGAALIAHVPAGQPRLDLALLLYACFGLSLVASFITITMLWSRLVHHGLGVRDRIPTLWIVLGPFGTSITAATMLGDDAPAALPPQYRDTLHALGVVYGVPMLGFALLWIAIAAAATLHTIRRKGLPFTPAWWSFVFPVGTVVTGTAVLARHTGSDALKALALALFAALAAAWLTAATHTLKAQSARWLPRRTPRRSAAASS
ncbi:TDT family transporter [Conexibacter woesei]|uniref:TDT family transporter n=1 Tax=Conexibacter woesei TaxID=191495 RepID=UPI000420F13D|nr:TDT family transporter [Conexibacter woesei]